MVVVMTLGFFGLITITIFHVVPQEAQAFVYSTIGGIGGIVGTIATFKFGSSASSAKKDDALISQTKGNQNVT